MPLKFRMLMVAVASVMWLCSSPDARSQQFPSRPVWIVVPFAAGGSGDVVARLLAAKMSVDLGQPVLVDNKPGGGTALGVLQVAKAKPDGYTLLLSTATQDIIPSTSRAASVGFDIRTSFEPISMLATIASIVVVNPSVIPVKTLQELIVYAKANPGKLNYASNGLGTTTHLQGELLKLAAGIDMVHIPYRGSGPQTVALLAGEVPLSVDGVSLLISQIQSGKLIGLGITSKQRLPQLPNVPAIGEILPGSESDSFFGLVAPAETPIDIINRVNQSVIKALAEPDIRQKFGELGLVPSPTSPPEFKAFIAKDVNRWADVVKRANLDLE